MTFPESHPLPLIPLKRASVSELELPPEAKTALLRSGVPEELRLRGWLGPTLFTPDARDGCLLPLGAHTGGRPGVHDGYVVGSIRETAGAAIPRAYAYFVLTRGAGSVVLVDHEGASVPVRRVNASYPLFLDSLGSFLAAWSCSAAGDRRAVEAARDGMRRLDPWAWSSADDYWPFWFEELET